MKKIWILTLFILSTFFLVGCDFFSSVTITEEPVTTLAPTTLEPTSDGSTTIAPTTVAPTTVAPTTTVVPTTTAPTTTAPTTTAPQQYTISFEENGGSEVTNIVAVAGASISAPTAPTKAGYNFIGWYTEATLTNQYSFTTMPANNFTLYAKWEAKIYILALNTNSDLIVNDISAPYLSTITLPVLERAGYTFGGWFKDTGFTEQFTDTVMPLGDMNLYAKWTINHYTISFEEDGGTAVNDITADFGSPVTAPADPTKTGYTFGGWYTEATLTNAYAFTNMPANNLTLYAKWTINQYTISFEEDGGSTVTDITADYGTTVTAPTAPTKEGHTFVGWYTEVGLNNEYTFSTMPANNITLYAKWEINTYTLEYVDEDGTVFFTDDYLYMADLSGITIPDSPEKVGHTFSNWSQDLPLNMPGNDVTITAVYTVNQYSIEFVMEQTSAYEVIVGQYHCFALNPDGTILAWGQNDYGQLGTGDTSDKLSPVDITANFELNQGEKVVRLITGSSYSIALTSEQRLFTWGRNDWEQLGDGTSINKSLPTLISLPFVLEEGETIVEIKSNWANSIGLTSLGRVFTWGQNYYGGLGVGHIEHVYTLQDITDNFGLGMDDRIIHVYISDKHTAAISLSGKIFTWGNNSMGELGAPSSIASSYLPLDVTEYFTFNEGESIVKIVLSFSHALLLTSDNRLLAWGRNEAGQLGLGTFNSSFGIHDITLNLGLAEGETIVDIFAGGHQSTIITSNDRVITWGRNVYGQLGDGTMVSQPSPIDITSRVSLLETEDILTVFMGANYVVLKTVQNTFYVWGINPHGVFGDGTTIDSLTPSQLSYDFPVENVYISETKTFDYDSAIDNLPVKEGYDVEGLYLDLELTELFDLTLMPANDLTLYVKWVVGEYTISFETNGGSLIEGITAEYNSLVQAPDDPIREHYSFIGWYSNPELTTEYEFSRMPGEDITLYAKWEEVLYQLTYDYSDVDSNGKFVLGYYHSFYLTDSGRLFVTGENSYGKLGNNSTFNQYEFIEITSFFDLDEGEKIIEVAASWNHSAAITSSGRVFVWGSSVATGTVNQLVPLDITDSFSFAENDIPVRIQTGVHHTIVLTESGQVFTFGQNIYGALGDGTQTDNYTPINITNNFNLLLEEKIVNIYSQGFHVMSLSSNGRLFGFGRNFEGELGDGSNIDQLLPKDLTPYLGLQENETIVDVEAGWMHTVILTSNGRVISSGGNWQGIIGDGTIDNSLLFKDVTSFFNLNQGEIIVKVSSKEFYSLALSSDHRLFIYGQSSDYLSGSVSYTPVDVTDNLGLAQDEYITEIYTGSQHGILITNQGRIIGFGLNSHGELGFNDSSYYGTPVELNLDFISSNKTYEYYAYGETLSLIIPEKEGYVFMGWYIDPELTNVFDLEVMPGENVTLYPKWELDTYQVTYVVDGEFSETELWPLEYQYGSSYPIFDIHLDLGLFLGWYLTPDFSGEPVTDLEGYSGDIIFYGKVMYTDLVSISQLLSFDVIPEKQIAGFTAKIKGLVYEVSAIEHYYILTDNTGFLLVYSDIVMEVGKEYEVTGSFELYNDDPYSYEPPFWPMITDVNSVTLLGNENGFSAPTLMTIDFATLELVAIEDYNLYGQPVTITGELDYLSFSSQYVLIDNSLSSSVTIYISIGVEDQALSDYLLNNIGEVINLTGFILNIDYLDGVVSSVYIVVDSIPS